VTVQALTAAPGSGGGGGCFIATAAFGSPLAPEVQILRSFRDRYLMTSAPGRMLVAVYYRLSPPAAALIREHPALRAATRIALRPVIWGARLADTSPVSMAIVLVAIAGGGGLLGHAAVRRWRARVRQRDDFAARGIPQRRAESA
jgi:hypothetical protein